MNCIVSSYLTTSLDAQRGIRRATNDPAYIQTWYDSIVSLGLNGVILHDSCCADFIFKFPGVKFIKVPWVGEYQLYDYRWIIYRQFLRVRDIDNIFFTDISDVRVVKDPFTQREYKPNNLYCGDEPGAMNQNEWMKITLQSEQLCRLPGFSQLINSDKPLLNCGIFGGGKAIVMQFLSVLIPLIEQLKYRKVDQTVDMPLYNYVAKDFNVVHGAPLNSVFKAYENRSDVWFIHK